MTFRFLASFHYHRNTDLSAIVDAYPGPCEVFVDSGAYSAHSIGATVSLTDYAAWLRHWQPLITTAATLDVIGSPDATHRNTETLEDMGLRVLPVFHVGSPWDRLDRLCRRYDYVALGGMVPFKQRSPEVMRWLIRCFQMAREHGTVFHGFGLTKVELLRALPFYSVDSSTWAGGARFGALKLWDSRRSRLAEVRTGNPTAARRYARLITEHGLNPATVGRPGFAILAQRTREQYTAEDAQLRGVPALAFTRLGEWLTARHKVSPPPGWSAMGTVLYLADTNQKHFFIAAQHIAAGMSANRMGVQG